jgi:hypothetical protein
MSEKSAYIRDNFEDQQLQCEDCFEFFVWTRGEQRYFADKQFSQPKRCRPCRAKRKQSKELKAANAEQANA